MKETKTCASCRQLKPLDQSMRSKKRRRKRRRRNSGFKMTHLLDDRTISKLAALKNTINRRGGF
jgi:hypothetical protein